VVIILFYFMVDLAKVKTQIEYYLSDKNLEKDKFFRE
jgi:hypothetical protein